LTKKLSENKLQSLMQRQYNNGYSAQQHSYEKQFQTHMTVYEPHIITIHNSNFNRKAQYMIKS